ncbi:hypothetical protein D3867_13040 [Azospirillum argentinense]|uniref:Uncharacterized protein n=1 Tax=Azospirillum brasilense TaxID=192 RepID=A0A4D8PYG8_AZOBR|nr:hypothetical protein D3867_13040 [Azospirillum argentinense]
MCGLLGGPLVLRRPSFGIPQIVLPLTIPAEAQIELDLRSEEAVEATPTISQQSAEAGVHVPPEHRRVRFPKPDVKPWVLDFVRLLLGSERQPEEAFRKIIRLDGLSEDQPLPTLEQTWVRPQLLAVAMEKVVVRLTRTDRITP